MRLLLSADWQIGARFGRFGIHSALLREARMRTFRRVLTEAEGRRVDALVIAGDLFEDHQIDKADVEEIHEALASHLSVPTLIVPGNHDPASGPGTIWARKPFSEPSPHVRIITRPETIEVADGWLLINPLTQKHSALDPSAKLAELARGVPSGVIKVGITHGSPAIGSKHAEDDFPIALDAASRAGLDFLGIGHWHSALSLDGGRMLMAGTPEPTDFAEQNAGFVHEIELMKAGEMPRITAIACAELRWREVKIEMREEVLADAEQLLAPLEPEKARTILRITLTGSALPSQVADAVKWLRAQTADFAVSDFQDVTKPELSADELTDLEREHPLLVGVLEDLKGFSAETAGAWTRKEMEALADRVGCGPDELVGPLMTTARGMLLRELREVQVGC